MIFHSYFTEKVNFILLWSALQFEKVVLDQGSVHYYTRKKKYKEIKITKKKKVFSFALFQFIYAITDG